MSSPKIWLITGCSSGFGLALARAVLHRGNIVIATSRQPSKTPDLVKEINDAGSHWIELDFCSDNVAQTVERAYGIYNRIDVVVNNAGFAHVSTVEDLE